MDGIENNRNFKTTSKRFITNIINDNNNCVIEQLEKNLLKYGLLFNENIYEIIRNEKQLTNNEINDNKKSSKKFIRYLHLFWRLFHSIHWSFCFITYLYGSKDSPKFYFDVINSAYLGGIKHYLYSILILVGLMSIITIYTFNFSDPSSYSWLSVLIELKTDNTEIFFYSLRNKIKILLKIIPYYIKLILFLSASSGILVMYNAYNLMDFILFGILSDLIFILFIYSLAPVGFYSFLCYYIVCEYIRWKFKSINESFREYSNKFTTNPIVFNHLIHKHNILCKEIHCFNKFWKRFFFNITYTLMPTNLLLLHQIIFGKFDNFVVPYLLETVFVISFSLYLIMCLTNLSINRESKKSFKILFKVNAKTAKSLKQNIKVVIIN